jgi:prevent-host-death family protein
MATVGIFEAKTRLSEIVRLVEEGEIFTITLRGKPVVDLVPTQRVDRRRVGEAVRRLLALPKIEGVSDAALRGCREKGGL